MSATPSGPIAHSPAHVAALRAMLSHRPGVREGRMFGCPAFFAGGRLFACVLGDEVGVKVPAEFAQRLLLRPDVTAFRPHGRPPMRQWLSLRRPDADDLRDEVAVLEVARRLALGDGAG